MNKVQIKYKKYFYTVNAHSVFEKDNNKKEKLKTSLFYEERVS